MFNRLEQLNAALSALETPWRTKTGVFKGPLDFTLVANEGTVIVKYVDEIPQVGEVEDLLFYQGRLLQGVNDYPFMVSVVQDFEEVFRTSVVVAPQLFETLAPMFMGLYIEGPDDLTTTVQYKASLRYATETGQVVDIYPDEGLYHWTSKLGAIKPDGTYEVGLVYTKYADELTVQVQTDRGNRWQVKAITVEANSERVPQRLSVYGPNEVRENSAGLYIAAIEYENGESDTVSPTWSLSADYASINANGRLTVGVLQLTTTILVKAEATVNGVPFNGDAAVVLRKTSDVANVPLKWGVMEGQPQLLTQEQFNSLLLGEGADGRRFNFTSSAGVGQRSWLAVPRQLGVPQVLDANNPTADSWSPPIIQTFKIEGVNVEYFVLYTMFDNLGQRQWQVI